MKQVIPEIRDLNKLIRYRNRHSVAPFSFAPSGPKFPSLDFVHITPDPRLPRLMGTDERVLRFVEVFGGVLVLGREAQAQVNPGVTRLNAVLTDMLICFSNFDLV